MPALANPIGVEHGLTYCIVGPDGTRAVINGVTDPDFVGFVNTEAGGITGLERAGVRENADVLPEADGGLHGAFRYDRLPFTIPLIIPPDAAVGDSWVGRQARLLRATDAMDADALLLWTPSGAVPVQTAFRQQQPTRITGRRPKLGLVAGVSEDNLIYSQAEHVTQINAAGASVGGFTSPLVSPLVSGASPVGVAVVNNAGSKATWPVLYLYGPLVNPVVTFAEAGAVLRFTYTLAAGEFLRIDTNPRRRTIRLNDAANRYRALNFAASAWAPMLAGNNTIRLGVDSYAAGAMLEIRHRDAWG